MAAFEYGSAIKITFDLPIVTELPVVNGTEQYYPTLYSPVDLRSSGDYSGYPKENAFDGSTGTYWRSASATMPQWIGKDYGQPVELTAFSAYLSSYKPANYKIQGSNNNVDWVDVYTGTFTATTGWQGGSWTAVSYRYWRLYVTSLQSTRLYIYELTFTRYQRTRNTYDVAGWLVQGYEPSKSPGGSLVLTTYQIRKITKADADYSLILWLKLPYRMKHPQGLITVTFTGSLVGPQNAAVAPFSITLTPGNIDPIFNPNDPETVKVTPSMTLSIVDVFYEYYQSDGPERVEVSPSMTLVRYHINDIPE